MKPRVAFFSFTGCEGCQLAVLECENELLDIVGAVDIVTFREAISEKSEDYDIAFIDGAISKPHDVEEIKHIRERAKMVIPIGSCACTGGLNAMKNKYDMDEVRKMVYGDMWRHISTIPARPVSAVVPIDFFIPGCPIDRGEFLETVKALLLGKKPTLPDYPVCVECKRKSNVCVFELGMTCLGPVTRAGCGAICPSYGDNCVGCRGWVSDPNINSEKEILTKYGMTVEGAMKMFGLFNSYQEAEVKE
jgi:sulfhydrogenase subunit delta